MDYKKGDVCSFLLHYQVQKGSEFTHTSIIKPTGAFYIPSDKIDNFYRIYKKGLKSNDDLYLTEKHRDISPFLIDLDFRFEKELKLERKYSDDDILNIIKLYVKYIYEYVDTPKEFDIYIMEKPYPVIDKDIVKDGLHIVIPDIVTKSTIQHIIRKKIISECGDILDKLNLKNSYDDVFDEAVIERNNWQMYGSKKPNCERYKITKIFKCTDSILTNKIIKDDIKYVDILSIRNKYDASITKIDKEIEIDNYEKSIQKSKKIKMGNGMLQTSQNMKKNTYDNLEYVNKLVEILNDCRADIYIDWIRIGWCLRNIDYRLIDTWITFSKRSSKFTEGECEKVWNYMKDDGLGLGTLHMWAKKDNLNQYKALIKKDLSNLIFRSKNETHHDIANVIYFMYKYDYVCISIKHNAWYEFRNHRWVICDSGHGLRCKISTDVCKEYMTHAAIWSQKGSTEDDESEQQRCAEIAKKLNGIALKLKQTAFKDNVMKECRELFYLEKFEEKLDSRTNLIGFENGVYDLESFEFRDGRPEDYISFTTNINYIVYDENHYKSKEVNDFLSKVLMKPHMKEYVLLLLSSFLNGGIKEERFHIWTGNGSNGKSKTIDLFEQSFGDYCCKLPITLLTQKRAASNAATSELARTKGKRFACLQEPSEDEKLNVGLMKELTGGDKIQARLLFKEPIEFKPQFKMILTCNNLPNVPSDDGGTWRRIRVVEFQSKFTDVPDPEKENEFLVDTDLSEKFSTWNEAFMGMLIEYYKKYRTSGITEPEEVLQCTKEYQKNNDIFLEFVEQEFEKNEEELLSFTDIVSSFKVWCKDNSVLPMNLRKKEFTKVIIRTLGRSFVLNKIEGWKGWGFKKNNNLINDDLE
jgi:P4 family phage/plasmid primase-like protien